jgi:atypical dual specificity phosphatase
MSSDFVFELNNAGIFVDNEPLLQDINLAIKDKNVTVILGPGGTGKSSLVKCLSGIKLHPSITKGGSWNFRGDPLLEDVENKRQREIFFLSQSRLSEQDIRRDWESLLPHEQHTWLLDEPDVGLSSEPDAYRPLVTRIREHTHKGSVIVITHHLDFAKQIADDACLVCAGKIQTFCDADTFFNAPPTELVARYVRQGNCWPMPSPPELPTYFFWQVEGKLAGMGKPGLLNPVDDDLMAIATHGISYLITLTETPVSTALLRSYGITGRHFPIRDMGVPAVGPTARLCRDIERAIDQGESVAVHCHAGLGRTGTILAAYLVWKGTPPDQAIVDVRNVIRGSIQTTSQENFIKQFAESV